jgi:hypothetical protein
MPQTQERQVQEEDKGKKDDSSDDDDDEKKKTSHTRRRMARKRIFIRRGRMARHTLLVIGSWTLNHLVAHPMMKVMMRRKRWALL